MKIIHFADLHIGIESFGKINPETGLSTRLTDILKALDTLVDYAIEKNVDLVLFCGDTYKNRDPSQTHQREFASRLKRLSEANIAVFLLIGNHDLPNAVNRATAVEIFRTLDVSNIYVGSDFDIYRINTRSGVVQILALPWLKRSVLMARDDMKNLTIDELNEKLEEIITQRIIELAAKLDDSLPRLFAAHVSVSAARSGSERTMLVGREPVLLRSNVALPEFDYVALGHIHKTQVLHTEPPVVYAGSLERLDFSDEKEEKGFYEIDIEYGNGTKRIDYNFHSIDARRFVSANIDIARDDDNPMGTILNIINNLNVRDSIVKIQIALYRNMENIIRESEIYKALKESYYFTIGKEFKQEDSPMLGLKASEELTPMEALKIYLTNKKVPEDRMRTLVEYGEKIIEEVSGA